MPLLYIDDNANDQLLVRKAILLTKTPFTLYQAGGMESAIPYFQSESEKYRRPSLILLDYDLGGPTGVDFLYWLRLIKKISSIPVIMFSGTVGKRNIAECYATGANHFLIKPKNFERLKIIVRTLHQAVVDLPRPGLVRLLHEYKPDPREHSDTQFKHRPLDRPENAPDPSADK